jgi:NADPH-dependent 2,4-dienoyl-CoA reductase/sulfur reductase-like enzyme
VAKSDYKYVIAGGGLAGASAIAGIREVDRDGAILLIGGENHLPYDRPPLTKKLWFGKQKLEDITLHDRAWYENNGVELLLGAHAKELDADRGALLVGQELVLPERSRGASCPGAGECRYEKLLLATGGTPRLLDIPGADLDGVCYYRTVDHYVKLRADVQDGRAAVVVGGGFIGSELAAGLHTVGTKVTMVFRGTHLVPRVFPEGLGKALQAKYQERGIAILADDAPASFERRNSTFVTQTQKGQELQSDVLVVGAGITPSTGLAGIAGLAIENGIVVNECLETSHPGIYAAGDNANFPYQALGKRMRVEHWDNALNQGRYAGWNMAGRKQPYTYMPYFFSDLFEFGYEAVGDIDPSIQVVADWQKENEKGVLYFLQDGRVRGAMMCDVWDKVPAARELIESGRQVTQDDLRGAIM